MFPQVLKTKDFWAHQTVARSRMFSNSWYFEPGDQTRPMCAPKEQMFNNFSKNAKIEGKLQQGDQALRVPLFASCTAKRPFPTKSRTIRASIWRVFLVERQRKKVIGANEQHIVKNTKPDYRVIYQDGGTEEVLENSSPRENVFLQKMK